METTESPNGTIISETVITFRVLHRTDAPIEDLGEALQRAWDGDAVGLEGDFVTTPVPDEEVADRLVSLGNDGTFFDFDLGFDHDLNG